MPLPFAFLAHQTSDTAGTGTLTLNAAAASRRAFATATGGGSVCVEYRASLPNSSEYEIGIGVHNGSNPGTLTRVAVLSNHLGTTSLVSFSAGTKDVQLLSLPGQRGTLGFTANTTATLGDLGCLHNFTGSANATLTLPAAATVPLGAGYLVRNAGTAGAVVTIDGNGSELVGPATTLLLFSGETVEIFATATGWTATGLPVLALVRSQTLSGTPSVLDFNLPTTGLFEVAFSGFTFSADAQLGLRTSVDGGSSFAASASDYGRAYNFNSGAGSTNIGASAGTNILLADSADATAGAFGSFLLHSGDGTFGARVWQGQSTYADTAGTLLQGGMFQGSRAAAGAVNAIRFMLSTGTFTAGGVASLYHRRR